jgi:hypothetical protein
MPKKGITALILTCCNLKLVDKEELHPLNCQGYRYAREEMQMRKSQSSQDYNGKGVLFQVNHRRTILY